MKKTIIIIICILISFSLGYCLNLMTDKNYSMKLEEDLQKAQFKMSDIEKTNDELLRLNGEQQKIIDDLKVENEMMISDLNNIKSITNETKIKLENINNSIDSSISIIGKLKENQKILQDYILSVSDIMGE